MKWHAYFRLMRFHKPIGILLLWIPTAWALWIANNGHPSWRLIALFLGGTVVMRAAGCIVNDIADRHIDKHVNRTQQRPLTTGEVSLIEAILLTLVLLCMALWIVIQCPILCFYYALFALLITVIYPFCKRFFDAPQLVLGLAFSMGIPMAYAASGVELNSISYLLMILNFAWIVAYDTIYAMADKNDDRLIGVKSTAICFGAYDRLAVLLLQAFVHGVWLYLGYRLHDSVHFYVGWMLGLLVLFYQQWLLEKQRPELYMRAFAWTAVYGFLMWVAVV